MKVGKIYFVEAPGRIKIGYTRQPERRLSSLQAADMEKLTSIGVINGTRHIEALLHKKLQAHRLRGEWFADCAEVRNVIERAIAGEYSAPAKHQEMPVLTRQQSSDYAIDTIKAAVARSKEIANECAARVRSRESISDLVQEAKFLAEHVIGPGLYGIAPEIVGKQ